VCGAHQQCIVSAPQQEVIDSCNTCRVQRQNTSTVKCEEPLILRRTIGQGLLQSQSAASAVSLRECRAACAHDESCAAFSFLTDEKNCTLRSSIDDGPMARDKPAAISGVCRLGVSEQLCASSSHENQAVTLHCLRNGTISNVTFASYVRSCALIFQIIFLCVVGIERHLFDPAV
jgi:hypothetical protein